VKLSLNASVPLLKQRVCELQVVVEGG